MEASSQNTSSRGLWNNPRPAKCSKEGQDMLRTMKEESRLTNFQRKQSNRCPKNGAALPQTSDPEGSSPSKKFVQKHPPGRCQRRSAESCWSGNSYEREKFCPGPTRNLEKEKRRLQSILATGKEESTVAAPQKNPVSEERDRYLEIIDEIEERRQFLADMAALGQETQYIGFINTEISQRIRELELLEQTSSKQNAAKE
ncbi:UPF0193 protein EVG1 isoform 1-T4 [Odontesthes bonariensis]|uniref:UPF0193 protein EVG1 n=1 Tax=Odontesthes bonariensis TaxID=219752 RepID=UPI003F585834